MGHWLVWHGQNICGQQIQHSWPAGLDHDGVSWILDVAVRYEHVAAESRCRGLAVPESSAGRALCMFLYSQKPLSGGIMVRISTDKTHL